MEGTVTTVDYVGATEQLWNLATSAIEFVVANPLLLTFTCAGLVFTGIGIFKSLK